ncbi:MAG: RHS repeat-associated core domain-containing protein, partial [Proteobacteria bacterium]|nr:RHS repeat-associated core domain-containing protein [Pseudomonadota bacterium]
TSFLTTTGQYFDAESGVNYNDQRDYDSQIGRFLESDPIGLIGGINSYQYSNAKPLTLADPLGLSPFTDSWAHYCDGTGTPRTIPFNMVDWSTVTSIIGGKISAWGNSSNCVNAIHYIDENMPTSASGEYKDVIGRHVVRSIGIFRTSCDCSWSYSGTITSALGFDPYDFNPSNRGVVGEVETWIGAHRCPYSGRTFLNYLPGSIPVTLFGKSKAGVPGKCCK